MTKGFISSTQLDNITSKIDITEIISEYLSLKKTGKNFKALCPFHEEKTPSFVVNPEKQIFHCFGCGVGGNVIKFLMMVENLSFPEAAILAGEKAGVKINLSGYSSKERQKKEILIQANEFAAKVYTETLLSFTGKRASEYLFERDLSEKDIEDFKIGFAPATKDYLLKRVLKDKLNKQDFIQAGLLNSNGSADIFRNRILFPIFDFQGKIMGFGGRALDNELLPKYLNTSENILFNKGRLLYGLNWAKQAIKEKEFVFIVEGYFDVCKMHLSGMENCVAPMGTALTTAQLRFLKRFTDRILLVFDSDEAGIQASLKNLESVLSNGFETKICLLPINFDPDRFIDEYGADAFKKLAGQSVDFLDFVLQIESQRNDVKSPKGKSRIAKEIMKLISLLPDEIEQSEYIKILAKKLDINEKVIVNLMKKREEKPLYHTKTVQQNNPSGSSAENLILEILLSENKYWTEFLEWKGMLSQRMEMIAETSKKLLANNLQITPANLISNLDNEMSRWISGTFMKGSSLQNERKTQIFQDCLKKIHKSCISNRVEEIKKIISEKKGTGIPYNKEIETMQHLLFELKRDV